MEQVREAIGVTLSILCSNIRLHSSFARDYSHEGGNSDVDNPLKEENWVLFLTERASDVVTNIQNASQSDNLEIPAQTTLQNGSLNGDTQDDVKWMETVLICRIILYILLQHLKSLIDQYTSFFCVAISFYHLNLEVWKIFLFTGCYCGISLSCNFPAGM